MGSHDREDDAHTGMEDGRTDRGLLEPAIRERGGSGGGSGGIAAVKLFIEFSLARLALNKARLGAQRDFMRGAKKNRDNPFAKNNYANLDSVLESIADPLCDNGLLLTQWIGEVRADGKGRVEIDVWTRLEHADSGEYMQVRAPMPVLKHDPQGVGSATTYGRRYGLKPAIGIPEIDDDGAAASGQESEIRPKRKSAAESKRDGTTELFNEIRKEIAESINVEHLRHVGETRREELENMPDKWADLLRDDYSVKLDELKARGT